MKKNKLLYLIIPCSLLLLGIYFALDKEETIFTQKVDNWKLEFNYPSEWVIKKDLMGNETILVLSNMEYVYELGEAPDFLIKIVYYGEYETFDDLYNDMFLFNDTIIKDKIGGNQTIITDSLTNAHDSTSSKSLFIYNEETKKTLVFTIYCYTDKFSVNELNKIIKSIKIE